MKQKFSWQINAFHNQFKCIDDKLKKMYCRNLLLVLFCGLLFKATNGTTTTHIQRSEYEDNGVYPYKEHSLVKTFDNMQNWETTGETSVKPQFIRLTPDEPHRNGGIWNKLPINFPNWEVQLEFKISGKGRGNLHGNGLAFWYVRNPMARGDVFGSADFFHGLGVFMDTYVTRRYGPDYPYISAMVNNGTFSYDNTRDGKPTELAGCKSNFRSSVYRTAISIRYYHGVLLVRTDVDQRNLWSLCFATRVHLPVGLYIGVTAATGELSDNHDILELKTYRLDYPPPTTRDDTNVIVVLPKNDSFAIIGRPFFSWHNINLYMFIFGLYIMFNISKIYYL